MAGRRHVVDEADEELGSVWNARHRGTGDILKAGLGRTLADCPDDFADLSHDSRGAFVHFVGKV